MPPKASKKEHLNFPEVFIAAVVVVLIIAFGSFIWSMGNKISQRRDAPVPKATAQARLVHAKQERLEQIAKEARVGKDSAYITIRSRNYNVAGTNGGSYDIAPEDFIAVKDIFCRTHNVHSTAKDVPVPVNEFSTDFIIYFESVPSNSATSTNP